MSESTKTFWKDAAKSILVALVVGIVTGMASAYLTVRDVKMQADTNTSRISTAEKKIEANAKALGDVQQETSERLIRLETKIDLLLDGKLKGDP